MTDPTNVFAMDDIKFRTGLNVEPVVASETAIQEAVKQHYGAASAQAPRNGENGKGSVDLIDKAFEDLNLDTPEESRLSPPPKKSTLLHSRGRAARPRSSGWPTRCSWPPSSAAPATFTSSRTKKSCACGFASTGAAVRDDAAAQVPRPAGLAHQDHGAARHRREAPAAGRPHQGAVQRPRQSREIDVRVSVLPTPLRREDRDASARLQGPAAGPERSSA